MTTKKPQAKKSVPVKKSSQKKSIPAKPVKKTVPVKKDAKTVPVKKQTPSKKAQSQKTLVKGKGKTVPVAKKTSANEPKNISVKAIKSKKSNSAKAAKVSPAKSVEPKTPATKTSKTKSQKTPTKKQSKNVANSPASLEISVPRDVSKLGTQNKLSFRHSSVAYTPLELEQLLFQRGVTNMNIFNPNAVPVVHVKKPAEKKIILTTLPKSTEKRTIGAVSMTDLFGFDPFAKDSVSAEEKLIPAKWIKYYHKLVARKNELMETINRHSQNAFRKEGKEETGDVSAYSQHTADIDNEAFDRDFAISRLATEQEELSEINIAVERMKKGTYGICEITGKPIPAERLNKVPFTRYSLEGKVKAEEQRRAEARRRRANVTGDISEVIDIENDAPITLSEEREEP